MTHRVIAGPALPSAKKPSAGFKIHGIIGIMGIP